MERCQGIRKRVDMKMLIINENCEDCVYHVCSKHENKSINTKKEKIVYVKQNSNFVMFSLIFIILLCWFIIIKLIYFR